MYIYFKVHKLLGRLRVLFIYSTMDSFKLWTIIVTFTLQRKEYYSFVILVALKSSSEPGGITGRRVPFPMIVGTNGAPRREHAARPEEQPVALRPATLPSSAVAHIRPSLVSPASLARARVRRPRRNCSWRQSAPDATEAEAVRAVMIITRHSLIIITCRCRCSACTVIRQRTLHGSCR